MICFSNHLFSLLSASSRICVFSGPWSWLWNLMESLAENRVEREAVMPPLYLVYDRYGPPVWACTNSLLPMSKKLICAHEADVVSGRELGPAQREQLPG